jgi:hypothetical protein
MPETVRDYLHAFCMRLAAGSGVVGVIMFRAAVTLDQHIAGALVLAVAGAALFGAYQLKPKETAAELEASAKERAASREHAKEDRAI